MTQIITRHLRRNPDLTAARAAAEATLPATLSATAYRAIAAWPGYCPTPLERLTAAEQQYHCGGIYYKDESVRFGLESFKALGGAYALQHLLQEHIAAGSKAETFVVATATDGNHGRSVAWGAQQAGCRAKIYVHREVSDDRISAIAAYGADMIRVDGNYDDSVEACREEAARNNWTVISDTSWEGYTDIPRLVMAGYTTLMYETLEQLNDTLPTHVLLQAGVGAMAAALVATLLPAVTELPRIIIVESEYADCLLQSAEADAMRSTVIREETVMAGLSCGVPSLLAWQILSAAASDFVAIRDEPIGNMMRQLAAAGITGGECAAAGLAVLAAAEQREALGLDSDSRVLLIGSEGVTDKVSYQKLTGHA